MSGYIPPKDETGKIPRRWRVVMIALPVMAFMVFALVVLNLSLVRTNSRQDTELRVAAAKIAAAEEQRRSERETAKLAKAAECTARVAGAKLGNAIIGEIRSAFNDLSKAVDSEQVRQSLRTHAKALPHFTAPSCPPADGRG